MSRSAGLLRRVWAAMLACAALLALGAAAPPAQASEHEDPLFVFVPKPPPPPLPPVPPPTGRFNGPCGLAVDSEGRFYVSDYYHTAVDVFRPPPAPYASLPGYVSQLPSGQLDTEDASGPCGLALDSNDRLHVNVFHHSVLRFASAPFFGGRFEVDTDTPTGVAVDPLSDRVYVNNRTYVSIYEPNGEPVMDGEEPLRIGEESLGDAYGLAVSGFAPTAGLVYVPDAADDVVEVYNPLVSTEEPVETIAGPGEGFVSLKDTDVAVDAVRGDVYVVDVLQPRFTEEPEAIVHVFAEGGAYAGHLKYNVVHGEATGVAVDNSMNESEEEEEIVVQPSQTQGRVYVTSGNTNKGGVYAYGPGAATMEEPRPPTVPMSLSAAGSGGGTVASADAQVACTASCEAEVFSGQDVTITASADEGSTFLGWRGGGCSGTGPCEIEEVSEATAVSAKFESVGGDGGEEASSSGATGSTAPSSPATAAPAATAPTAAARRQRLARRRLVGQRRCLRAHRRLLVRKSHSMRRLGFSPRRRRVVLRHLRTQRRRCVLRYTRNR